MQAVRSFQSFPFSAIYYLAVRASAARWQQQTKHEHVTLNHVSTLFVVSLKGTTGFSARCWQCACWPCGFVLDWLTLFWSSIPKLQSANIASRSCDVKPPSLRSYKSPGCLVLMYAKCSRSPWFLQIPAEDDEGEGRAKVGIRRSLALLPFWPDRKITAPHFIFKDSVFPTSSLKTRNNGVFVLICVHFHLSFHEALEGF